MAELQMLPDPDLNADDRNMGLDTAVASEPDEPQLESPRGDPPVEGDGGANKYAATELARLRRNYSRASSYHRQGASIASKKPVTLRECCIYYLKKFWRHQISVTVDYDTCRDHLALERTFLGYLRTSLAFSMIGITVAQLFRLQHVPSPNTRFGFHVLGTPLSCICQGAAIYTLMIGAFRIWRSQNAIVRGKAISGGFELVFLATGVLVILLLFFVLLLAVDVTKEDLG